MLAYAAVNNIAASIAKNTCDKITDNGAKVVIYDPVSFQNLQAWRALKGAIAALDGEYQTLADTVDSLPGTPQGPPPPTPPSPTPSGSSFFAGSDVSGLVSAIAASTTNTATSFSVTDSVMAVALLHEFRVHCSRINVAYFPLAGNSTADDVAAIITLRFAALNQKRTKIQKYLEGRALAAQTTTSSQPPGQTGRGAAGSTGPLAAAFTDLNTQYDSIVATLTASVSQNQAPSATATPSGVTSILDGSHVESVLTMPNTYVLYADVVAAGGIQKDMKNLLTILFTGDWIRYSGGVIVNYALLGPDQSLIDADVLRYRISYSSLPDATAVRDDAKAGDNLRSLQETSKDAQACQGNRPEKPETLPPNPSVPATPPAPRCTTLK